MIFMDKLLGVDPVFNEYVQTVERFKKELSSKLPEIEIVGISMEVNDITGRKFSIDFNTKPTNNDPTLHVWTAMFARTRTPLSDEELVDQLVYRFKNDVKPMIDGAMKLDTIGQVRYTTF